METIKVLPPQIKQFFDKNLLSKDSPEFRDSCKVIWRVYLYIKNRLRKKVDNDPIRLNKYLELEKQFLELYERTKAKEEERKIEEGHHTQEPFYYFRKTNGNYQWLFDRLKCESQKFKLPFFRNNAI
jgi:hypothetical protein